MVWYNTMGKDDEGNFRFLLGSRSGDMLLSQAHQRESAVCGEKRRNRVFSVRGGDTHGL